MCENFQENDRVRWMKAKKTTDPYDLKREIPDHYDPKNDMRIKYFLRKNEDGAVCSYEVTTDRDGKCGFGQPIISEPLGGEDWFPCSELEHIS
ncbi:MAG: hypothetical protein ACP5SH_26410 [Syntrophobacteraceae bacterium]